MNVIKGFVKGADNKANHLQCPELFSFMFFPQRFGKFFKKRQAFFACKNLHVFRLKFFLQKRNEFVCNIFVDQYSLKGVADACSLGFGIEVKAGGPMAADFSVTSYPWTSVVDPGA